MVDDLRHATSDQYRWSHRLALLTAATTMLLIVVGGLVTNTGSALAVPDWPTTFGYNMFTYPWSQMVGGIFYEHTHRLLGSTVGLLTVSLAVCLWWREPRRWVRRLGVVAVAAVIVQGVLGGLRVVLLEHGLAPIHGCVAQAFLGLMVSLTAFTSDTWRTAAPRSAPHDAGALRTLAMLTAPLVYLQLVFGALLTHTGTRLDAHLVGAGVVTLAICLLGGRVVRDHVERAALRRPAVWLFVLLGVQLSLGLGAYLWHYTPLAEVLPFPVGLAILAAHRLTGTAIWATSLLLSLRVLRLVSPGAAAVGHAAATSGLGAEPQRQVLA